MIRRESGSIDQVMRALQELEETVNGAQLRLGNQCVVSRPFLMQRMETIGRCLPEAVTQGAQVIQQEKDIIEAARREAAEQLKKARDDAQKILDEAKQQAETLQAEARKANEEALKASREAKNHAEAERAKADREAANVRQQAQQELANARQQAQNEVNGARQQAQQVYDSIVSKAQYEANNLTQQAEAAARAAVSQDNVHRMAVVAAQEMQDAVTQETAVLRQRGVDYVDSLLRDADSYLCALMEDIRKQRQALDDHR